MSTITNTVTTPVSTTIQLSGPSEPERLTMVRTLARDALNNGGNNPQIPTELLTNERSSEIDTGLVQFLNSDSVTAEVRANVLEAVASPSIDGTAVFNSVFNSITPELASTIDEFLNGVGQISGFTVLAPIHGILTLGFAMGYADDQSLLSNLSASLPRPSSGDLTEAIARNAEITETRVRETQENTENSIRRLEEINENRISAMNRFSLNLFNLSMNRLTTIAVATLGAGAALYFTPRFVRTTSGFLSSLGVFGSIANSGSDAAPSMFGGSPSSNPNSAPTSLFSWRAVGHFLIKTGQSLINHNDDDK